MLQCGYWPIWCGIYVWLQILAAKNINSRQTNVLYEWTWDDVNTHTNRGPKRDYVDDEM
jgi:hypothetical protein